MPTDYNISTSKDVKQPKVLSDDLAPEIVPDECPDGPSRTQLMAELARKNVELTARNEELRRSEQNLSLLGTAIETAANAVVITDNKGTILWFNPAFTALTGYTAEDAIGRTPRLLKSGKHDREFYKSLWATILTGKTWRGNFINRRKDGSLYYDEHTITPVRSGKGAITHFIAIMNDVTERRQVEAQLAEKAALLDKTRDAIIERDLEGRILFWNKASEQIFGWTLEEALGQNIADLLHIDPLRHAELKQAALEHGGWSGEIRHLTKNRRELTLDAHSTLVRDEVGRPKSVLVILTDITEKKKIESQFMRAQRMESIGMLAGGVAHDLNNILAPIMMSIDILKTATDDPEVQKILKTIEVSSKRGASIVRQVLSFARGVEGERIEVQAKHLLKDLENIIKDTFPKDIELQFTIPEDTWMILGDPTQVQQIFMNLCVNARDAMPQGGILSIRVENCVVDEQYAAMNGRIKPGQYVSISVADSGTGMPPGIIEKIFEPFFTTKELGKGTGLGLSTVMAIVKNHEGIINVCSEPGTGTTFIVRLPAVDSSAQAQIDQPQDADMPRGNGETVLVVDDEASILSITSETLEAFGYQVLTAKNGAEAVAIYANHKDEIAVVLIDTMMPVMNGHVASHSLAQINPAVKIIISSGLDSNPDGTETPPIGSKTFLAKPYTAKTLLKTVRATLDRV